jgi:NADH-quinone oxidoreductase subunit H
VTAFFQSLGLSYEWAWTVATLTGIIVISLLVMFSVAMVIYVDRKVLGAIMMRRGPNVVGPFGLLQSFADGLKVFLQETIIPSAANKGIFLLAPIITFTVALAAWAVIPFSAGVVLADINVGLLYILAISSMGVYGVVMSGWASNSKYPFFSAMRASAQMISYEVSIGFVLVCVVLFAGTFNLSGIVNAQQGFGLGFINAYAVHPLLFPMWVVFFISALAAWAVIPFDAGVVLADINVGLLYILAISSMGVYGVVMSGWASNSKYPFFSAMRASAQMISYEVSIGFVLVCVVLFAGTFNLSGIVNAQQGFGLGVINAYAVHPLLFPMWVVFFISALAETARAPFDLTEAESELVAGYQTEYSSMSFALFWLGEYANILLMCSLNTLLFWGGWLPPIDWAPLYMVPGIIWFLLKTFVFFFMFSWIWATVPRYRYDQLMRLGWKVFLPMSLLFVAVTSGYLMATGHFG